ALRPEEASPCLDRPVRTRGRDRGEREAEGKGRGAHGKGDGEADERSGKAGDPRREAVRDQVRAKDREGSLRALADGDGRLCRGHSVRAGELNRPVRLFPAIYVALYLHELLPRHGQLQG